MSKRTATVFLNMILCVILTGTAITDICGRKVLNRWLLPGLLAGLTLRGIGFFIPVILMFIPVYFLFRIKVMGAGDGKVLMLIAGSLGLHDASIAVFFGFIIAAIVSAFHVIKEKNCRARVLRLRMAAGQLLRTGSMAGSAWNDLCSRENSIPLAACLAAGTIPFILIRTFVR